MSTDHLILTLTQVWLKSFDFDFEFDFDLAKGTKTSDTYLYSL